MQPVAEDQGGHQYYFFMDSHIRLLCEELHCIFMSLKRTRLIGRQPCRQK